MDPEKRVLLVKVTGAESVTALAYDKNCYSFCVYFNCQEVQFGNVSFQINFSTIKSDEMVEINHAQRIDIADLSDYKRQQMSHVDNQFLWMSQQYHVS